MITRVTITNFKKLEKISFPLAQSVVIIGPNNSGKTTVLQALALWEIGVTNCIQAYQKKEIIMPSGNPILDYIQIGDVVINRKDLLNNPVSDARFLWRNKNVAEPAEKLAIELEGENDGKWWKCKAEFEFANEESFNCRVVSGLDAMIELFERGKGIRFGFLQPMSGLSFIEDKLSYGSIDRKLGEGKTAEVLRNICYGLLFPETPQPSGINPDENWGKLAATIKSMFGVEILKPEFFKSTGIIQLEYIDNGIKYEITSSGGGFQQTLLLLAYMFSRPGTILLLDEPDAHLEVIREKEIFQLINSIAQELKSQVIIASHSEVVLEEAAEASTVIALIENTAIELNNAENPHIKKHLKKALTEIGWEKYYQAKLNNHILFLEGSTDLEMLKKFASKLNHKVEPLLHFINVEYTGNNVPNTAVAHFVSLKEFIPKLKGLALFDKIQNTNNPKLDIICWKKRELENYFARPEILIRFANVLQLNNNPKAGQKEKAMQEAINENTTPARLKNLNDSWWNEAKISDEWLDVILPEFYKRLNLPQYFFKRDYYQLIMLLKPKEIDPEIVEKLDAIYSLIKKG